MDRKNKLSAKHLSKSFFVKGKDNPIEKVVDDVSLDVYENEFLVILGPGRCGKTVLMKMIGGLLKPDKGEIVFCEDENKKHDELSSNIGMVFQRLSLFPWKKVMANVEYGLMVKGIEKNKRQKIAQKFIDLVGLTGFENSFPSELSGGMKQRVGIARAYSCNPEVLLMDEPFGQLDAQTRYSMQQELLRINEKEKKTTIFVTNNIEEALYLGDRIIVLSKCPATVKKIFQIDMKHPRDMMDSEFLNLRQEISDSMDLIV